MFQFDHHSKQFLGLGGYLPLLPDDELAWKFTMLVEGECSSDSVGVIAERFGFSRQRYYQLRKIFHEQGIAGLMHQPRGPQTNYRRHQEVVCQTIRHRFLDPEATTDIITQKLRQTGFKISKRTVDRIVAEFGLQKKTLQLSP